MTAKGAGVVPTISIPVDAAVQFTSWLLQDAAIGAQLHQFSQSRYHAPFWEFIKKLIRLTDRALKNDQRAVRCAGMSRTQAEAVFFFVHIRFIFEAASSFPVPEGVYRAALWIQGEILVEALLPRGRPRQSFADAAALVAEFKGTKTSERDKFDGSAIKTARERSRDGALVKPAAAAVFEAIRRVDAEWAITEKDVEEAMTNLLDRFDKLNFPDISS